MRLSLASRTGFGVLLALTGACNNSPMEVADASETKGDETTKGSSEEDDENASSGAGSESTKGQESQGSTTTVTSADSTTAMSTSLSASGSATDTSTTGPEQSTDEESETTESAGTGLEPNRGCTGEAPPSVTLTEVIGALDDPDAPANTGGNPIGPTALRFIAADPGHAYVSLRSGKLLRIDLADPVNGREVILRVDAPLGLECGFFSFEFHPDYDGVSEQRLYVSHTPECELGFFEPARSLLSEYAFDGATATYVRDVISIDQPANNHNGGLVMFGPDGYLYFALGDGGGRTNQFIHGQDPTTPLATILRFDPDDLETPPPGNLTADMVGGAQVFPFILHWGLRNPWQFSFDRVTGDLYIADVGEVNWEEIDVLPAGAGPSNFGWPAFEGTSMCPGCQGAQLYPGVTDVKPIHVYPRMTQASISGGFVYRGTAIPELWGRYVYADFTMNGIRGLTWDGADGSCDHGEIVDRVGSGIVSFAEDLDGELYVVHMVERSIFRLDPS